MDILLCYANFNTILKQSQDNQKLKQQVEQQYQQIIELSNRKK